MIYFAFSMAFFLLVAYIIYYNYTIYNKIFASTQLAKLGIYARLYNFFEDKTSKERATLFAEVMIDELFSESFRREKSVLFHIINKEAILRHIYQLVDDHEIVEMLNIALFAEALVNMKNGLPKEEAMKKLTYLDKYTLQLENIEKRYPLKIIMFKKANRFYRLTKSDAIKAKIGKNKVNA